MKRRTHNILIEYSDLEFLRKEKERTGILMHRIMKEILKDLPDTKEPVPPPNLKPLSLRNEDALKLQKNAKAMGIAPWQLIKILFKSEKLGEKFK